MKRANSSNRIDKMKSKAQISIEFIAGFGIFIMVISYVIYASITVFPKYFDESRENAVREKAWTLSIEAMDYLRNDTQVNNHTIAAMAACGIYHHFDDPATTDDDYSRANYTYLKDVFSVDGSGDFRISIKSSPVIITDTTKGQNRTGDFTVGSSQYTFESVFNTSSLIYDHVVVSNSSGLVADSPEGGTVQLGEYTFSLDKIDTSGEFLIMGTELVDCGMYAPMSAITSKVTRFTTYKNWITTVDIVYW